MSAVVVIGAGLGGLAAAASLARSGVEVLVLEAQTYPGGCAGTFYHQGYRFDAGATLAAGFYPGGPMDLLAQAAGVESWPARTASTAMLVHLPGGIAIPRLAGEERWQVREHFFGVQSLPFWRWQERTAEMLWKFALRLPPWPPQSPQAILALLSALLPQTRHLSSLLSDAFRPLGVHLSDASERLRSFVDGQLLISAQAESGRTNALYGAAALDLPRRGVAHIQGGMGALAQTLVQAIQKHGGRVLFRQEATSLRLRRENLAEVLTRRGDVFPARQVIANLTPWNAARLLADALPPALRRLPPHPHGWGAFVVYAGVDSALLPEDDALHHQVLLRRPFGEGNTVFVSASPAWDASRAPRGSRAITVSTHTRLDPWWKLYEHDREAYRQRSTQYTQALLTAAEVAYPGLSQAVDLVMPGSPVTFARFTHRERGWVGGFPQTSLFSGWGPRLAPNLWLVGDSVFPGQSAAAAALSGLRVAAEMLQQQESERQVFRQPGAVTS
jgi:C-3',4' desaturase CrtD